MSPIHRRQFISDSLAGAAILASIPSSGLAQDFLKRPTVPGLPAVKPPPGIKTFSRMPRSLNEVASAHLSARQSEAAEFLKGGELLEFNSFAMKLTARDGAPLQNGKLPNPSTRRFMLSVGIDLKKPDQARLPTLSKDTILKYLADHYVSVQARVQKDARGNHYLHHRCIVATGTFRGGKFTEDFQPAVGNSVKEIHSLGIFLPSKLESTPDNLRTAVLVHKHIGIDIAAKKTRPEFEMIIFRGRESGLGKLDLHCFVTTDQRTKLHYVKPAQKPPTRYEECSLKAQVYFSRYVDSGLVPSESVVRNHTVNSQASFVLKDLDAMVKKDLGLTDTWTNLNEALDAIIEGKFKPDGAAQANVVKPATTSTSLKK